MKLSLSSIWKQNQNPIHFHRTIINRFYGTTSTTQNEYKKREWVYARITPLGSPDVSMVPALEQWVKEGKEVKKTELQWIIKQLISYKRYKHALEDFEGMDKIVVMMECDKHLTLNWKTYIIATEMYLKVGQVEKALELLSKLDSTTLTCEKSNGAYSSLLKVYAEAGKKEEVYRVWEFYICVMSSLMKFGDIEGVEKIFEEWESEALSYDFRVPDVLIRSYCRNGLLGKAKALVDKGMSKGGVPWVTTWCHLANGYIHEDLVPEAVEALKKAISIGPPNYKPSRETLATCVKYWEKQGNVDDVEDFVRSLEMEHLFSPVFCDKFFCFIKEEKLQT
ncbi:unnamed protein product [Withania somnifera]